MTKGDSESISEQAEIINLSHGFKAVLQHEGVGLEACLIQRWQGYLGEYNIPSLEHPMIAIVAGGKARIRRQLFENELSLDYAMPRDITLIPRKQPMRWHVHGDMDVISVIFSNGKTCQRLQDLYNKISHQFGNENFVGSFTDTYIYSSCDHITNVLLSAEEIDARYVDVHLQALELYIQNFLSKTYEGVPTQKQIHSHYVSYSMQRITQGLANELRIEDIAKELRISHSYLTKRFKQELGITPHHFLLLKRIKKAQDLLANTTTRISAIAEESGFSHQSHLTRHFSKIVGMSPLRFRQRAKKDVPQSA